MCQQRKKCKKNTETINVCLNLLWCKQWWSKANEDQHIVNLILSELLELKSHDNNFLRQPNRAPMFSNISMLVPVGMISICTNNRKRAILIVIRCNLLRTTNSYIQKLRFYENSWTAKRRENKPICFVIDSQMKSATKIPLFAMSGFVNNING